MTSPHATPTPAVEPRMAVQEQKRLGKTKKGRQQEPELKGEGTTAEPTYEVRVTVTLAIPYYDDHPGCRDATERVMTALRQTSKDVLPQGTHYHGEIVTRVRTAKEIASDYRRAEKRAKERGYHA